MTEGDDEVLYPESPEVESFFDALEAAEVGSGKGQYAHGFFDRPCGLVEANGTEIVAALLAAGWEAPERTEGFG